MELHREGSASAACTAGLFTYPILPAAAGLFLYSMNENVLQVNTGQMNGRDGRLGPRGGDFKVQPETSRMGVALN